MLEYFLAHLHTETLMNSLVGQQQSWAQAMLLKVRGRRLHQLSEA